MYEEFNLSDADSYIEKQPKERKYSNRLCIYFIYGKQPVKKDQKHNNNINNFKSFMKHVKIFLLILFI